MPTTALTEAAIFLRADGQTVMFLAANGELVGLIGVADPIMETSAEAVRQLHADGARIIMLTGDNRRTAEMVANRLGTDEVVTGMLPDQKIATVQRFQADGRIVAIAGDGVNDAPALAQPGVGVAMGSGTDVGMECGSVTLGKGDLCGIVRAWSLSRQTIGSIRQNLFPAFVYNAIGVPVAPGPLYPESGWLLTPMIAAVAMPLKLSVRDRQCAATRCSEAVAGRQDQADRGERRDHEIVSRLPDRLAGADSSSSAMARAIVRADYSRLGIHVEWLGQAQQPAPDHREFCRLGNPVA